MAEEIEKIQQELESASQIILALPNVVTPDQRRAAEVVVLNFRKTSMPYKICCALLERSQVDYVLFETAGVIKSALIREWTSLPVNDIISLRQYLIQYMLNRPSLAPFIRERMVQIIAIMVKRGNINTTGVERKQILDELENIVSGGDLPKQLLSCSIMLSILQEYATTIKSADVGLTWEAHTQAKVQFQNSDLKRIFQFCYRALDALTKGEVQPAQIPLIKKLLEISETILRWCFVHNTSKHIEDAFGYINASANFPILVLDDSWKGIILDLSVTNLYFNVYWKIRESDAAEHGLRCLVQFGTLRGKVIANDEDKKSYMLNYMQNILRLVSVMTVSDQEALAMANMFTKPALVLLNPNSKIAQEIDKNLLLVFLEQLTNQSCYLAQNSAQLGFSEDSSFTKAFECILRTWIKVMSVESIFPQEVYKTSITRLFNTYLQCHLCAPDGFRSFESNDLSNEEIDASEEDDRTRFLQQLQVIGTLGRQILDHALPLLSKLIEDRTIKLKDQLSRLASTDLNATLNSSNPTSVSNLYEDLHWLVLISGHVLCMESDGEEPLIPSEIMKYCLDQAQKGQVDVNISMQLLASPQSNTSEIAEADQKADHVIRLIASVFRLCEIEKVAILSNCAGMLSPELSSTIVWFLHRWSLSFLLPKEQNYSAISTTLLEAFGADSNGAMWTINFLLDKIQNNINTFKCESSLIKETIDLLMMLVKNREKSRYIIKSDRLASLLELATKTQTDFTPTTKRSLMRVGVNIGLTYPNAGDRLRFWLHLLGPLKDDFLKIMNDENFNKIHSEEPVRMQIASIFESVIGIFDDVMRGLGMASVEIFPLILDLLIYLPRVLQFYHNYQQMVQLVLEVMYECIKEMLCYLDEKQSAQIYHICMGMMKTYAYYNTKRITSDATAEEDAFQDILLFMKMLTKLPNKTLFDLSEDKDEEAEPNPASVFLYGLGIIMPLMNEDLMKFPTLCQQYYAMLSSFCDVYPQKVISMEPNVLELVLRSLSVGLYAYSHKVTTSCCDFIHVLARHIYNVNEKSQQRNEMLAPFLPLMFQIVLDQQVNMDVIPHMSTPIFCLICCYPDKYEEFAQKLIQANPNYADRLMAAFTELIQHLQMNAEKFWAIKFESNFDKFIINLKGFLMVK